jgi:hypothetical protein
MLDLLMLFLFLIIVAATWFMGLWSNMLTLINLILAASIASCLFEPVSTLLETQAGMASYTYLLDFLTLWGIFFGSFVFFRAVTDFSSKVRVQFNVWVEMVGRSVLSIWIASVFLGFSVFTLHTAPLPAGAFGNRLQATPESRNIIGIGPDRMWMGFLQSRSRGALAESRNMIMPFPAEIKNYSVQEDPADVGRNRRVFDSMADFIFKYQHRRTKLGSLEALRVNK